MYDALQYVRTLNYVDQTRIGMIGHSQGSKNTSAAVDMDSSLYTRSMTLKSISSMIHLRKNSQQKKSSNLRTIWQRHVWMPMN